MLNLVFKNFVKILSLICLSGIFIYALSPSKNENSLLQSALKEREALAWIADKIIHDARFDIRECKLSDTEDNHLAAAIVLVESHVTSDFELLMERMYFTFSAITGWNPLDPSIGIAQMKPSFMNKMDLDISTFNPFDPCQSVTIVSVYVSGRSNRRKSIAEYNGQEQNTINNILYLNIVEYVFKELKIRISK